MGDSSDIDALIKDMNNSNLSNEENSMVNSILNELNGPGQEGSPGGPKVTSQQQKPQITDEEKEMLSRIDDMMSLDAFTEREQAIIENLIRKSLVSKVQQRGSTLVMANEL